MWALVPHRKQLLIVGCATVVCVWALQGSWGWLSGEATSAFRWIPVAATVVGATLGAAGFAWRFVWSWFPWVEVRTFPDLTGTWQGHLKSTWLGPDGQPAPPIPVMCWIKQGLFTMSVRMRTSESQSWSTRFLLEADHAARCFRAWYSYANRPDATVSHRSSPHEGVAWLEVDYDNDPNRAVGQYFTARRTTGDIELKRKSRELGRRSKR